jgi:Protein of unknown function (DUF3551)
MKSMLIGLALAAAAAALSPPARAQSNYPWCAYYGQGFSGTNCGFTTFEQCMETVHGIGGFCQKNDWYHPSAAATQPRRRSQY